jgi:hypothetical protein
MPDQPLPKPDPASASPVEIRLSASLSSPVLPLSVVGSPTNESSMGGESSPIEDGEPSLRRFLRRGTVDMENELHPHVVGYRTEKDTMGEVFVPADKLWGAQTQRLVIGRRVVSFQRP